MIPFSHGACLLSTVLQGGIIMQHEDHRFKDFYSSYWNDNLSINLFDALMFFSIKWL